MLFSISLRVMGKSNSGNVGVSGWEVSKLFKKSSTSPCNVSLTSEASSLKCSSNFCSYLNLRVVLYFPLFCKKTSPLLFA